MSLSTANLIKGIRSSRCVALSLLFFVIMVSCRKEKRPDDVLSQEQMAAIMVDIYLGEARLNSASVPRDSAEGIFKIFEERLLQKAGVSDSTLKKSYQYYLARPKELELIYDSVIDTLSLREQKVKKKPVAVI